MVTGKMEFIDSRLVEHTYFLERRVMPVKKYDGNPVIEPCSAMQTVIRETDSRFRMWYATLRMIPRPGGESSGYEYELRYAESEDGRNWIFPELGLKERDGSRANNVIIISNDSDANGQPLTGWIGTEGFCVIDAESMSVPNTCGRYTALYLTNLQDKGGGLCLAHSDDGLHWLAYPENPVFPGWPDMFNNFFFDARIGRYVLYHRPEIHAGPRWANRLVARSESDDLIHWDNTRIVFDTDGRDASAVGTVDEGDGYPRGRDIQFYGMTVTPYSGFYLGMAEYYEVAPGKLSVRLVHSFDGIDWRREAVEEAFIPQTPDAWDSQNIGFVQTGSPLRVGDDLYFYYGGTNVGHHDAVKRRESKTARRGLGVGIVPRGRLAGYHAGKIKGELLTRPFVLSEPRLTLNVNAAAGEVKVGLTDENGVWIPGFAFEEAMPIQEDGLNVPLRWSGKDNRNNLIGKTIRCRIAVQDAGVYGFTTGDS